MPRENYYLLLELDPAIQDPTLIAIGINHPINKRQFQKNLEKINDIRIQKNLMSKRIL